jgi:uncharacterized protein YndB with AHSA1/START domain
VKAIHQEKDFNASAQRVYEILLDSKQFTAFSGGRAAEIHGEVGGTFSLFAGHIVGRNLELVPNQRIVQAWRVVTWPEGIYSIARFELVAQTSAGQSSATRIIFDHTGFPAELAETWRAGGARTTGTRCGNTWHRTLQIVIPAEKQVKVKGGGQSLPEVVEGSIRPTRS